MKKIMCKILVAGLTSLIGGIAYSADFRQCPLELSIKQTLQNSQTDWKTFNSHEKHPYVGVSFSEGSPDKKVILAPSTEKKMKDGINATWEFSPSAEGYWVSCLYAETSVTVSQKLPSKVQACEVEYDADSSRPVVKKWRCSLRKN